MSWTTRRGFLTTAAATPVGAASAQARRSASARPAAESTRLRDQFRNPGRRERPITWYFPSGPDPAKIASDLAEFKKLALGGICIMPATSALKVPYLSQGYWETVALTVEEAVRQGFRVWLYDELDYPSSSAGGAVIRAHPEYEVTGLEYQEILAQGGSRVQISLPPGPLVGAYGQDMQNPGDFRDLKGGVSAGVLEWNAPPGSWKIHLFTKRIGDPLAEVARGRAGLVRPLANLLDANAIREFISSTYEGYARTVGRYFGKDIEAMFTDEPCLHTAGYWDFGERADQHRPMLPWVDGFPEYFHARKGYDLMPLLPCVMREAGPQTTQVRCDYWDVVCDLIVESYFDQLRDWCAQHKIAFSGHVLLEEGLLLHLMFTGSFIRSLSRMHIPGIDLIGPRPEGVSLEDTMTRAGGLYVGKLASSAAHTRGRSEVMSESFAASGLDINLEKMIAIANWQYATGVTELMPMSVHYHMSRGRRDSEAFRKFLQDDFFKDPGFYATYLGRIKAVLTGGRHVADVAVLVPEVSIWANYVPAEAVMPYQRYREKNPKAAEIDDAFVELSMELLRAQLDYDYLDDEAFERAEIGPGRLSLAGESYSVLVLPPATTVRFRVAGKVAAFRRAGGRVVGCGQLPDEAMERGKDDAVRKLLAGALNAHAAKPAEAPAAIRKLWTPDVSLAAPDRQVYYLHKRKDGRDIYFFINMGDSARQPEITFSRTRGPASIWNPNDGETRAVTARPAGTGCRIALDLPRLSARFVVFG
jgi:hypothetical protein